MNERQKKLVEENTGLVYYIVNQRFNFKASYYDFDDLASIGTLGLVKAARTFDESRGKKFATYAGRCIENEIKMFLKKNKHDVLFISLDESIPGLKSDSAEHSIIELIADESVQIEKDYENALYLKFIMEIILNRFSQKDRDILLYKIAGYSQLEIANIINISQSYVSRLASKLFKKLVTLASDDVKFQKKYFFEQTSIAFQVFYSLDGEKRLIFQGPKCRESFSLLADAIKAFEGEVTD